MRTRNHRKAASVAESIRRAHVVGALFSYTNVVYKIPGSIDTPQVRAALERSMKRPHYCEGKGLCRECKGDGECLGMKSAKS